MTAGEPNNPPQDFMPDALPVIIILVIIIKMTTRTKFIWCYH